MYYFLTAAVIVLLLLYFMPVITSIDARKDGKNDKITIGLKTLFGLLRLKTEIPFLIITFKDGKPALKYKVEVADRKRSKLFARFSKLFSAEEGKKLFKQFKRNKGKLLKVIKYLIGKTKVKDFNLKMRLGTGEAAATGMLYGAAWIAVGSAMTFTRGFLDIKRPNITIIPVFSRVQLEVDFSCIINLKLGHIINTGIRAIPVLLSAAGNSEKDL